MITSPEELYFDDDLTKTNEKRFKNGEKKIKMREYMGKGNSWSVLSNEAMMTYIDRYIKLVQEKGGFPDDPKSYLPKAKATPPEKKSRKKKAVVEEKESVENAAPAPKKAKSADKPPAKVYGDTPGELYFKRLEEAVGDHPRSMLIAGFNDGQEEEEDEDEELEAPATKELTIEQVGRLRHLVVTTNRDKEMEKGKTFASNGDHGDMLMTFNTHSGNQVIQGIPKQLKRISKIPQPASRFDALFGLTVGLQCYEAWMMDNEEHGEGGKLEKSIKQLGAAWTELFKGKSSEVLGLDTEFSRPAVDRFLQKFAVQIADVEFIETEFKFSVD
jgi:hypothetical protein